jgi:hypothetical protein
MFELLQSLRYHRDLYAGGLVALVGIGAMMEASHYTVGSLQEMGPGFFPLALGAILLICGAMIALSGSIGEDEHDRIGLDGPDWRGWLCILGGLACFILIAERFGMFPGTVACVFVAALGDRTTSWKAGLLLALAISLFGVLLFSYGLRVQLPAFRW